MDKVDKVDIERAFKDEDYLKSLSPEQLAQLPWNPAGDANMSEQELDEVVGGMMPVELQGCRTTTGSCLASKRMGC